MRTDGSCVVSCRFLARKAQPSRRSRSTATCRIAVSRMSNIASIWSSVMISGGENTHMLTSGRTIRPSSSQTLSIARPELQIAREAVARAARSALDAADQADAARVADDRDAARSACRRSLKWGAIARTCSSSPSSSMIADVLQRRGAADRVAGIGVAVGEQDVLVILAGDLGHQPVGDQAGAERQVARGQALGAGDDVGLDAEHVLGREPVAEPAEGGDHLVGDVEHVVAAADLEAALMVARGRDDHAARGQDRLGDEGGDPVGAGVADGVLEVARLARRPIRRGSRPSGRRLGLTSGRKWTSRCSRSNQLANRSLPEALAER